MQRRTSPRVRGDYAAADHATESLSWRIGSAGNLDKVETVG